MLKKMLSLVLVMSLLLGSVPLNHVKAADINNTNSKDFITEGISQEDLNLDTTEEGLQISTKVDFDSKNIDEEEIVTDKELPLDELNSAKVVLDINLDEGNVTLDSTLLDEDGNKHIKKYNVLIDEANKDSVKATFVDTETGKKYVYDSEELSASWAIAIPIGINIGRALLATLFAAGAAITIGGVTYIAYKEFKKKKKSYSHYMASRQKSGLFIGNGLSKKNAVKRLKKQLDTWSTSKRNAQTIAKQASPISKIVGAEIDKNGKGKHYHYHPADRKSVV